VSLSDLAILWDLDGTIIDSTECHYKTWVTVLEKHGYTLSREVFKAHYGRNTKAVLPIYLGFDPDATLSKEIQEEKEILFRQLVTKEANLVPGVTTWLEGLKNARIRQAIASSSSLKNITTMLSAHDLIRYFDLLVSGANLPAKPNPAVFLAAAEQLDQLPENCLVIEDSAAGVEAARQAGMTCIAVTTSHTKSQLKDADLVLDDFNGSFRDALNQLGLNH
jgi:HAD superfamily hydrolase (TIGR01509 family)